MPPCAGKKKGPVGGRWGGGALSVLSAVLSGVPERVKAASAYDNGGHDIKESTVHDFSLQSS